MNWLGLTAIFVTSLVASVQATADEVTGTCASIDYSTKCCPPGDGCQASDGNCNCGADCYEFGDCCEDVYCPSNPRRCTDIGITTCCTDATNTELCDVHYRDNLNGRCSCNVSCHLRNDCCPDAQSIGCIPETCTEAGKHPGCCMWSASTSCHVPGGGCYCDSHCTFFNDCCADVDNAITRQCYRIARQQSTRRVRYNLEQTLRTSTIRRFNEKDRKTHNMQNANGRSAYNREILAAGTHRSRGNAREFRPRARTLN